MQAIQGLLFDKDGTLFDFQATWGGWAADQILHLANGDRALADHLAGRIGLDRRGRRFFPDSFMIAGTVDESADALVPALPHWSRDDLVSQLIDSSMTLQPVEAAPLAELLSGLLDKGFRLGVATNDSESVAVAQLRSVGVLEFFEVVIGADSGYGAKPAPGQCTAFCSVTGLAPEQIAMIGDSTHDLHAGAAAGMIPVAVLTGPASEADLAPHAEIVLQDVGHLPAWLGLD